MIMKLSILKGYRQGGWVRWERQPTYWHVGIGVPNRHLSVQVWLYF
jgi:hypothetical protein